MPTAGQSKQRAALAQLMALGPLSWFALTLISAALFWSGTIRGDATPYGDGSRILPWLSFVGSQSDWPTWNPFRNGGYPLFADPEQFWFLVPFVDPSSPHANLQLNLALFVALMLLVPPVWLTARRLSLTPPWAAAATLLAVLSESMVLAEQSARFIQLFPVATFAWAIAVLLKPERGSADDLVLALVTGIWLALGLQYAIIPGLAIWSAFVTADSHQRGWVGGLVAGTVRAGLVGLGGLALSAVVTLPAIAHFATAYLPKGLHYEPVVTASWSQAGRFVLPSLPGLPVFLTLIPLPALLIALMHRNHGCGRVASNIQELWALIIFLGLFVIMCIPGIGPIVASVYESVPILSTVRQLVGIALIIVLLATLWGIGVFQSFSSMPVSKLSPPARLLLAVYLVAAAACITAIGKSASVLVSAAVAAALALLAIGLLLSVAAPALARRFDPGVGVVGGMLSLLSIALVLPTAFIDTLPGTKRQIHVTNAIEQPEVADVILADNEPYVSVFKPDSMAVWHLHSQRRMGTTFSLYFPKSYAYTLAYLSPSFDLSQQRPHWVGTAPCTSLDPRALGLLAIRYLLCRSTDLGPEMPRGYVQATQGSSKKDLILMRGMSNEGGGLRVFCRWRAEPDGPLASVRERVLSAFTQGIVVVPAGETTLTGSTAASSGSLDAACPPSATSPVSVSMVRQGAGEMVLEAASANAGLLVIPDNFHRGWTATVNGTPVPIERAFFAYRGVPIGRGTSEVRLVYNDPYLRWGALVSGIALVTMGALAFWLVAIGSRRAA